MKLSCRLKKNQFPKGLINKVVNRYLDKGNVSNASPVESKPPDALCTLYFKLPYLVLSNFAHCKMRTIAKRYCKNFNIKLVFSSFKSTNLMNVKDSVPRLFRSNVVYTFIVRNVIPHMLVR